MTSSLDYMKAPAIPGIASSGITTKAVPPPKPVKPVDPMSLFSISGGSGTPIPAGGAAMPSIKIPTNPYSLGPDLTGNGPSVALKVPTAAPATPAIPQVKPAATASPASSGGIFKSGLSTAQIASLTALQSKPSSQWTDVDKKNWAYGTNGAAIPGMSPAVPAPSSPNPMPTAAPSASPSASPTAPAASPASEGTPGSAPATPSLAEKAVSIAQDAYTKAMQISPDELSTQADIDRLVESTKKAYTNAENQAIPLEFITGQMQAIEKRATDLAEPLDRKLARLQAARQSALDASKFALDRADKVYADEKTKAAEAAKTTEVGGNLVKLNPATGKYEVVYQAPTKAADGFTLSEGQKRYDAAGNLIASGPDKAADVKEVGGYLYQQQSDGSWKVVGGNGPTGNGKVVSINGTDYIQNADGTFSTPNLPTSPGSSQKVDALRGKVQLIDSLLTSKGMAGSVGPYGIARWTPFTADKADRAEFAAGVNQLISQETLDTLTNLKQQGGTLGALSDQERMMLQNAASKIGTWMIRDKNGNPTGEFEVSEKDFKAELNRIKDLTQKAIERAGGGGGMDDLDAALQSAGIPGFNDVPSTTVNGSTAGKVAAAIRQVESGGNYAARGGSGEFGAYQFMPSSWKQWAGQYLGNQNAPMTRANQDKVAVAHVSSLLSQGYNPAQVALIWNGGQPVVKKGINKYGVAYDSGAYARKVIGAMKTLA